MNDSENKKKIEEEILKQLNKKLQSNDMIDVSDDVISSVSSLNSNDSKGSSSLTDSKNSNESGLSSNINNSQNSEMNSESEPNNLGKDNSSKDLSSNDNKPDSKNAFNEISNLFNDNKYANSAKKGDSLKKNPTSEKLKDGVDQLRKEAKPMVDQLKNSANQLKEKGKDAAAKAGGAAISAATGGVVPPKLGEWASKKALNKIEKNNNKKLAKAKNDIRNRIADKTDKIKDKVENNEKIQKAKQKGADAANKIGKTIKAIKIAKFIKNYGAIIATVVGIFVAAAAVATGIAVIQTYVPGVFGDVKEEVDHTEYSKRDQKILKNIEKVTDKYPNVKEEEASMILATVSYPYHELLQNDNVKNYSSSEEDGDDETDSTDLLFESDSNLTASEKYEKYKGIYENSSEETPFKDWLADKFGYEVSDNDDEDDGNPNNDIYLTMYKKNEYLNKFDELMEVYSKDSSEEKTTYNSYLKNTYYENDKGYKDLLENVSDEDKEEFINDIQRDVKDNSDLYNSYIPETCVTTGSSTTPLNAAGNINDSIQGEIYIKLRDYRQTGSYWVASDHYASPILYGTDINPLPFARYVMGVAYAEIGEGVKVESRAKTIMVTAKSFTVGRYKSMGGEYPKPEVDLSNNRTIIEMRGNVGDQDFCDVYDGCASGTYAWSTRTEMRGSGNPKGPLSAEDLANLEKWWNEIADVYVVNRESGNFAGNQYNDYNDDCKQGSCVSQKLVGQASEKESDYMNILFDASNGGFDNTRYTSYSASTGTLYAVTTGDKVCSSNKVATGSRQAIVDFAVSMVGKIPYYFYEGQSDGKGALGHAISKNFDDNHFNEQASLNDHKGRNKYGLDCSGFVDFVFWNVLDDNLGNGNTTALRNISTKLSSSSDLVPGDLGFLSDEGSGVNQHVGIYIGNNEWVELNPNGVTKGEYPNFKVFYRPNILAELDQQQGEDVVLTGSTVYENPIPGQKITNAYGVKGKLWSRGYHTGSDFGGGTEGMEIHSIGEGTVYCISCMGKSFGNHVVIEHADGNYSLYAHMSSTPKVSKGQNVNHSTILGNVGSTGNVTGPHLHLEFWKGVPWANGSQDLNPANYITL